MARLNAEMSVERYWPGTRSQELGEERETILNATLSQPDRICIKMGSVVGM